MTVIEKRMPNPKAVKIKSTTSVGFVSEFAYGMLDYVSFLHWLDIGGPHKPEFPRKELLENVENWGDYGSRPNNML